MLYVLAVKIVLYCIVYLILAIFVVYGALVNLTIVSAWHMFL